MTAVAWAGQRVLGRDRQQPSPAVMWGAIAISALVFGMLHLPSVGQLLATLSVDVAAYIIIGNALFGLIAGYLFWRYGLEAAIIAHVCAHVFAFANRG
ncbi:CPBP family intramembrane metalloprotease [Thermosynechococcaceae cyanobacterium Okahandja]